MNIEKFRSDFLIWKATTGVSQSALKRLCDVDQASLSRFIAGKQGLSFNSIVALWPFVYGKKFPDPNSGPTSGRRKKNPAKKETDYERTEDF